VNLILFLMFALQSMSIGETPQGYRYMQQDMLRHIPIDTSAVVIGSRLGCDSSDTICMDHLVNVWGCKDKSRVLLTAEDGSRHCISFAAIEAQQTREGSQ
jgi:hypothetical protein